MNFRQNICETYEFVKHEILLCSFEGKFLNFIIYKLIKYDGIHFNILLYQCIF